MIVKHKIVYVITRSEIGGAQNHIISLLDHIGKKYNLVLVTGSDGYLVDMVNGLSIKPKIYVVDSIDSFNIVKSVLSLKEIFNNEIPDLIHTHSTLASIHGRLAARFCKLKVLHTIHGWHFANKNLLKQILQVSAEFLFKPLTTYWITVSQYDLRLGLRFKLLRNRNVISIKNGIEDTSIDFLRDSRPLEGDDKTRMVFVGRASFQKNCMEAIEIIKLCPSNVLLTMYVTSGDYLSAIIKLIADSNLEDRVTLIIDNPDASSNLHHHDAMLLTSRYEGMPLCVLEAMRVGLPIVSSDVCGMNEIVINRETGYLYPLHDVEEAANCVNRLLEVEKRLELGRVARENFEKYFRAALMANKTADIYEKLLSE